MSKLSPREQYRIAWRRMRLLTKSYKWNHGIYWGLTREMMCQTFHDDGHAYGYNHLVAHYAWESWFNRRQV